MVICETCGSNFNIYDGVYICDRGHTLQHGYEVVEQQFTSSSIRKSIKKENKTSRDLYEEIKQIFEIKTNYIYKLYYKVKYLKMEINIFLSIIYYSKRIEEENIGKTYLFSEFMDTLDKNNIIELLKIRAKEYKLKKFILKGNNEFIISKCLQRLKKFANTNYRVSKRIEYKRVDIRGKQRIEKKSKFKEYEYQDKVCRKKILFVKAARKDLRTLEKYFKKIIEILEFDLPEESILYFRKFVYITDLNDDIFIPEIIISAFLFQYIYSKNIRIRPEIENEDQLIDYLKNKFCTFLGVSELYFWGCTRKIARTFYHFKVFKRDSTYLP